MESSRRVSMVWLFLTAAACCARGTQGCTVFVVGKDATKDGSVLVSHSNDGEFDTDPRLVKVPAADYPLRSKRPVFFSPESYPRYVGSERGDIPEYYVKEEDSDQTEFVPIGSIPQVPHTFEYLEDTYGAVNEKQVGIGESTCSGIFGAIPLGAPNGTALFSIDQLTQIAMERSSTAREAIAIMGSLAEQYGFYGAGEFEGTAESLGVTDTFEAWIFHILPDPTGKSAIWAAQKIPSNTFAVLANMFVIREVNPTDTENFMMSDSVHSVARQYGWWKPNPTPNDKDAHSLLDFTNIYSDGEYSHKFYSGRRMWGAYHLACPSQAFPSNYEDLQSDPVYPVFAIPDEPLTQEDLFRFHRYTYQDTPFDLGAEHNLAGGPFGTPDRWKADPDQKVVGNWERPIGLYRTSDTYVVQSRSWTCGDSGTGAVLWYGPASPLGTVFTPFLTSLTDIPASYRSGHQKHFSRSSAFWAACFVHNIANLKWSYAIRNIETRQEQLERDSLAMVMMADNEYQKSGDRKALDDSYLQNAATVVSSLWSLSDEIMFKYASGFVNEAPDNMSQMVGYPTWWLNAVGYSDGPPPPPTYPKCCHPSLGTMSDDGMDIGEVTELTGKAAMKQHMKFLKTIQKS